MLSSVSWLSHHRPHKSSSSSSSSFGSCRYVSGMRLIAIMTIALSICVRLVRVLSFFLSFCLILVLVHSNGWWWTNANGPNMSNTIGRMHYMQRMIERIVFFLLLFFLLEQSQFHLISLVSSPSCDVKQYFHIIIVYIYMLLNNLDL